MEGQGNGAAREWSGKGMEWQGNGSGKGMGVAREWSGKGMGARCLIYSIALTFLCPSLLSCPLPGVNLSDGVLGAAVSRV